MNDALAFPVYQLDPMHAGLTKRELFAAMAMQGLLASMGLDCRGDDAENQIAHIAVKQADALIAALAKQGEEP
ncbi:MAG: hypothetical protein KME45_32765 [Stenomitos rutilans HA7619-LM2]|jgi:hypothetical protein|nr:hypothetical protein [Stenomitos rutilans HA7619-LM2]